MTNEPCINIALRCDRTNRVFSGKIKTNSAPVFMAQQHQKQQNAEQIENLLSNIQGKLPDLVVLYKGKFVILETVIAQESSIQRLLHDLTRSSVFPKPARRARKSTSKQGKRVSTPPVISESITDGEVRR